MSFIDWLLRRKAKSTEDRVATPPKEKILYQNSTTTDEPNPPVVNLPEAKRFRNPGWYRATTRGAFGRSHGARLWHEEGLRRMREGQGC